MEGNQCLQLEISKPVIILIRHLQTMTFVQYMV